MKKLIFPFAVGILLISASISFAADKALSNYSTASLKTAPPVATDKTVEPAIFKNNFKIGYVDIMKIAEQSDVGKVAKTHFESKADRYKAQIETKQKMLELLVALGKVFGAERLVPIPDRLPEPRLRALPSLRIAQHRRVGLGHPGVGARRVECDRPVGRRDAARAEAVGNGSGRPRLVRPAGSTNLESRHRSLPTSWPATGRGRAPRDSERERVSEEDVAEP